METPFYRELNKSFRAATSIDNVRPFLKYSWLLLTSLSKCPIYNGRMVYRAIRENLSAEYVKDKIITWRSFSSATSNIAVELNFLSKENKMLQGTLFHIELTTKRSRQVNQFSMVSNEVCIRLYYIILY